MTQPVQAIDALRRSVERQRATREAAQRAAEEIKAEREARDVSRETSEINR